MIKKGIYKDGARQIAEHFGLTDIGEVIWSNYFLFDWLNASAEIEGRLYYFVFDENGILNSVTDAATGEKIFSKKKFFFAHGGNLAIIKVLRCKSFFDARRARNQLAEFLPVYENHTIAAFTEAEVFSYLKENYPDAQIIFENFKNNED